MSLPAVLLPIIHRPERTCHRSQLIVDIIIPGQQGCRAAARVNQVRTRRGHQSDAVRVRTARQCLQRGGPVPSADASRHERHDHGAIGVRRADSAVRVRFSVLRQRTVGSFAEPTTAGIPARRPCPNVRPAVRSLPAERLHAYR